MDELCGAHTPRVIISTLDDAPRHSLPKQYIAASNFVCFEKTKCNGAISLRNIKTKTPHSYILAYKHTFMIKICMKTVRT